MWRDMGGELEGCVEVADGSADHKSDNCGEFEYKGAGLLLPVDDDDDAVGLKDEDREVADFSLPKMLHSFCFHDSPPPPSPKHLSIGLSCSIRPTTVSWSGLSCVCVSLLCFF